MSRDSLNGQFQPIKDDQRILPIHGDEQSFERDIQLNNRSPRVSTTKNSPIERLSTPPPSRLGSASTVSSKHRISPVLSPRLTNVKSVSSSVGSKVTFDDVCEALKKLEEFEQFPLQSPLKDDAGQGIHIDFS